MQIEEGATVSGKVTGITDFGAFVDIGNGKSGLVHISEVSSGYVKDINEHLKVGQEVTAKIISVSDAGKISLSIKKAEGGESGKDKDEDEEKRQRPRQDKTRSSAPRVWQGVKTEDKGEKKSFEDMMASFKKASDEKMSDLKRTDSKRGSVGYSRRGHK